MSGFNGNSAMSAKNIADYVSFLEERINELSKLNSKLTYDNQTLKDAIAIIKDIDLSKIKDVNRY